MMDKTELKKILRESLFLNWGKDRSSFSEEEITFKMEDIFKSLKKERQITISDKDKETLISEIINDVLGWGPLQKLMEDEEVTEIMVNGPYQVYAEKKGKKFLTEVKFDNEQHLRYIIEKMIRPTGRRVDESFPYVDFSLENGSRVNVILPPLSVEGPALTIRKFLKRIESLEDLINLGTLDEKMAHFLKACIKAKINMIFSGATGVGKTTTLEALSSYIEPSERIITIEDALELHLRQEHVVRLLTRLPNVEGKGEVTIRDLFINTLRMRPSRIILGEIRGQEALDFLQASNSGHRGILAVIHASSPEDVVSRLETMVFYSGVNLPVWAIRRQITQGLEVVVQQEQLVDGSRKITRISEIVGLDSEDNIIIKDLFSFTQEEITPQGEVRGFFSPTGVLPTFLSKFDKMGVKVSKELFEPINKS
ncbi:MAG: CpaF family protein [Candidatus Omnitrophica bacterium]|nr:CpaF family protein [Candidatus Omnitrophota bacterium]